MKLRPVLSTLRFFRGFVTQEGRLRMNGRMMVLVSLKDLNNLLITEDYRSMIDWLRSLEECVFDLVQFRVIYSADNYSLGRLRGCLV